MPQVLHFVYYAYDAVGGEVHIMRYTLHDVLDERYKSCSTHVTLSAGKHKYALIVHDTSNIPEERYAGLRVQHRGSAVQLVPLTIAVHSLKVSTEISRLRLLTVHSLD